MTLGLQTYWQCGSCRVRVDITTDGFVLELRPLQGSSLTWHITETKAKELLRAFDTLSYQSRCCEFGGFPFKTLLTKLGMGRVEMECITPSGRYTAIFDKPKIRDLQEGLKTFFKIRFI